MLTKDEEKVLKYLVSKLDTSKLSKSNRIIIGSNQYNFCNLPTKQTISTIKKLHELNYIKATFKPHEDGTSPCYIDLNESALNYDFHQKERKRKTKLRKKEKRFDRIFVIITTIIGGILAIIGGLISYFLN